MNLNDISLHTRFIDTVTAVVATDTRFEALLGAGSMIGGGLDACSDLDFVVVCASGAYAEVMASRQAFAAQFDGLLSAFTGEHVGEPRLLICLYGPELLHVDFKFVEREDLRHMVERPTLIWVRAAGEIAFEMEGAEVVWPNRPPEWFETRAWTWLHYGATKLRRGELFEAISLLSFFRDQVLGPMLLRRYGRDQRGMRRIEQLGPEVVAALQMTHPDYEAASVATALKASVMLYLDLRGDVPPEHLTPHMPDALALWLEVGL